MLDAHLNDMEAKIKDEDISLVEVFSPQLHLLHHHLVLCKRGGRRGERSVGQKDGRENGKWGKKRRGRRGGVQDRRRGRIESESYEDKVGWKVQRRRKGGVWERRRDRGEGVGVAKTRCLEVKEHHPSRETKLMVILPFSR